jgi:hypothetical protein
MSDHETETLEGEDPFDPSDPSMLIEGGPWGDVVFCANWLLAAAKAEAMWNLIQGDKQFGTLLVEAIPNLGVGALDFLSRIKHCSCVIKLSLDSEPIGTSILEEFVMMCDLGFFTLAGDRYLMTVPTQGPDIDVLRAAASKICETEDVDYILHPERFITAMPRLKAEEWERRLSAMNQQQRCSDRAVFLEDWTTPPISNII